MFIDQAFSLLAGIHQALFADAVDTPRYPGRFFTIAQLAEIIASAANENPDDLSKIKTLDQKEYEEEERHFYFTTNRHFYDKISIKIILDCNKSRCSV